MSKSKKNYISIEDILAKHDADTVKLAFMTTHYRKPFNWEESTISEAEKTRIKLVRAKEVAQPIKTGYPTEIDQALEEDFNVPKALGIILKNLSQLSRNDFAYIEKIFGLRLNPETKLTVEQEGLYKERNEARSQSDYAKADELRKKLEKEGIMLEDGPTGTRYWKKN